jgi:sec-independent protein translocase protein TatB
MFDIGFAELVLIGVVALLVIGPERLPETIRTATTWLNRIRRGFNEIKQEVQQELHNDSVMRDLRQTGEDLKNSAGAIGRDLRESTAALKNTATANTSTAHPSPAVEPPPAMQPTHPEQPAHPAAPARPADATAPADSAPSPTGKTAE